MDETAKKLSIGFAPCPNDTFIFYALVHGRIDMSDLSFQPPVLEDVETLNRWALEAKLDVTKISFHALGHVLDDYVLLNAGSALGRGCGPLLVARQPLALEKLTGKTIAIPGQFTTAALLLQLFNPACAKTVVMPFDEIMQAVADGKVDAGVIIHEGRFTYHSFGLVLLQDLGKWWEETTGYPIPLGGIAVRRSLPQEIIHKVDHCIKRSVRWAFAHQDQCMTYIKQHAQELDDKVIGDHIALYVNAFSQDLGKEGLAAVSEFFRRGREAKALPISEQPLTLSC